MAKRIVQDLPIADRLNAASEGKSICYDRETGDYACFLDRQYLGHAATYQAAETTIATVYYEQLIHEQVVTADLAADAALPFAPTVADLEDALSTSAITITDERVEIEGSDDACFTRYAIEQLTLDVSWEFGPTGDLFMSWDSSGPHGFDWTPTRHQLRTLRALLTSPVISAIIDQEEA